MPDQKVKGQPVAIVDVEGDPVDIIAGKLQVGATFAAGSTVGLDNVGGTQINPATEDTLAAMSAKLPATLGQTTAAASISIVEASDSGLGTEATLASILAKIIAAPATEATLASVLADTTAILAKLIADPATEATLAAQSAKLPATLGQKAGAASLSIIEASDSGLAQESGGNLDTIAADTTSIDGKVPSDPAKESGKLSDIDGKLPATIGQKAKAASLAVTLASDEDAIESKAQDGAGNALTSNNWMGRGEAQSIDVNVRTGPNMSTVIVLVQAGDVGADYVAGSVGQVKTMKEYPTGASGGTNAKLTTFKYADAAGATVPTSIVETTTTV